MDSFSSTKNSGILKDSYGDEDSEHPIAKALKKRREALFKTKEHEADTANEGQPFIDKDYEQT